MKHLIIALTLFTSLLAQASIDEADLKAMEPTEAEVATSRGCFHELERLGCGHPREDLDQFKSCLENVNSSLSSNCQNMMGGLYKRKKK